MKDFIIRKCMSYVKKNTNYDKQKLIEIKYGLSTLYLVISKFLIISIFIIANIADINITPSHIAAI